MIYVHHTFVSSIIAWSIGIEKFTINKKILLNL